MDEPVTLTARDIADLLETTKRSVALRAQSEGWTFINKQGRGGSIKHYLLSTLPSDIQARHAAVAQDQGLPSTKGENPFISQEESINSPFCDAPVPVGSAAGAGSFLPSPTSSNLSPWQNTIAGARFDLCAAFLREKEAGRRRKKAGLSRGDLMQRIASDFCDAFNKGMILKNLHGILGDVAPKTLEKWARLIRTSGYDLSALAPQYGQHKKGIRIVSEREMQALIKYALHPNQLRISQVIRWAKRDLERDGIPSPSSDATLRRAIEDWKNTNYDKWVFARQGEKALVDDVLPYIQRDPSLLEVGECLVADGHTLNFQVINPLTGRPGRATLIMWFDWASRYPAGWNIMFTESTQSIHAALRRAILALGKLPKHVLLDNGRAFKAKVFTQQGDFEQTGIRGLYARLGIDTHFAWPYNARSKPVERFFGSFNELERLLPSYTGQSIEDKPAHMHRNERLHRKLHENAYVPTIEEAHGIIKSWAWTEYAERSHEGLAGKCPAELWKAGTGQGVDEELLRILMMSIVDKTVRRNGIIIQGVNYYHEALYGYRRPVQIRYDIEDMDRIHVYSEDGADYICTAEPVRSVHPLASTTGNPLDMHALKQGITLQRRLKQQTVSGFKAKADQAELPPSLAGLVPQGVIELHPLSKSAKLTPEESERIEVEAAQIKVLPIRREEKKLFLTVAQAYEHHLKACARGEQLTADQEQLMKEYEASKEFSMLKPYYDGLLKAAASGGAD